MRGPDTEGLRGFSRSWFCRTLWEYGGNLTNLNAQLALKPEPGKRFVANISPRPYHPRSVAPPLFCRAQAGKNPDNWEWVDRETSGTHFNLFLRVSAHLPGSEDWLFRDLHAYLRQHLPPIDHTHRLLDKCLYRLGLNALPQSALDTASRVQLDRCRELSEQTLRHFADLAYPVHVMALFGLWHLSHWQRPYSPEAESLDDAFCRAVRKFLTRPEFVSSEAAREAAKHLEATLWELVLRIRHEGFRAPPSKEPAFPLGLLPLLVRDFDGRNEAIACASAGTAIPFSDFDWGKPRRYRRDVIPSRSELELVAQLLLNAADVPKNELLAFGRDQDVVEELAEPQERQASKWSRRAC